MTFKRFCTKCGKRFQPKGKFGYLCEKCMRKNYITRLFEKNKRFKDCNDLKEAIKKHGGK